jgi:hypothetical protein
LDQGRAYGETLLRLKHRHGDAWYPLVEAEGLHERAEQDVERKWISGRIFRCQSCAEAVLVEEESDSSQRR